MKLLDVLWDILWAENAARRSMFQICSFFVQRDGSCWRLLATIRRRHEIGLPLAPGRANPHYHPSVADHGASVDGWPHAMKDKHDIWSKTVAADDLDAARRYLA